MPTDTVFNLLRIGLLTLCFWQIVEGEGEGMGSGFNEGLYTTSTTAIMLNDQSNPYIESTTLLSD